MRLAILALLAAAAAATPAAAEKAPIDINGNMYCYASNLDLRANKAGGYDMTLHLSLDGDLSKASFPGGKPFIGQNEDFKPVISTSYKMAIGKDGKPLGRPTPFKISISLGRFIQGRPEPIDSLHLKLVAGAAEFPLMPLEEVAYSVAVPAGGISARGQKFRDTEIEVDEATLGPLVMAVENNERTVTLLQDGRELARIPFAKTPIQPQVHAAMTWGQATVKAMIERQSCT